MDKSSVAALEDNETDADGGVVKQITDLATVRWNGQGRIAGVKHEVHGLAFFMGPVHRAITRSVMGQEFHDKILLAFTDPQVKKAIKTYAAGDDSLEHVLLTEYDIYNSGTHPDYHGKIEATNKVVEAICAELIANMDSETKSVPIRRLHYILDQKDRFPTDQVWWSSLPVSDTVKGIARSKSREAIKRLGVDLSMMVGHACSVERTNKDLKQVVSKKIKL